MATIIPTGKYWRKSLVLLLLSLCSIASVNAEVTVRQDRQQITIEDSFRLTIRVTDGEDLDDIDLSELALNFDILGRSSNSRRVFGTGGNESWSELILSLAPKHTGTLTIPALNVDGVLTPAGQLIVTEQAAVPAGTTDLVFVEAEVDKKSIYVQSQLIFTLRIYQSINLDNSSISELKIDDSFIEQLSQTSNQRTIGGRPYLVHDIKYAIFPQKSGELKIPSLTFTGNQSSGRRSLFDQPTQGRRIRRQTDALTITVKPIPNQFSGDNWLPASELTISESWSIEPEKLKVGESTTRTLTIKGKGLLAAQLPPNLAPSLTGAKFYPDQPQLENEKNELGVSSQRIDSSAIIMTQAGDYTLPETRIPWWDTTTNTQRWLTLPARQFSVAASSEQKVDTQNPVQISDITSNTVATEQNSPQAITVERLNPSWWWAITLITSAGLVNHNGVIGSAKTRCCHYSATAGSAESK